MIHFGTSKPICPERKCGDLIVQFDFDCDRAVVPNTFAQFANRGGGFVRQVSQVINSKRKPAVLDFKIIGDPTGELGAIATMAAPVKSVAITRMKFMIACCTPDAGGGCNRRIQLCE
jgi:hypothetical protein